MRRARERIDSRLRNKTKRLILSLGRQASIYRAEQTAMALKKVLLFTATAGSAAALAPNTSPRRRRVTCRVLDDAIDDLEALGDLGALDAAALGEELDLEALVAGAGLTVASTAGLADAGGAVPALAADLSTGVAATLGAEELLAFERDGHICTRGLFSSDEISAIHISLPNHNSMAGVVRSSMWRSKFS